MATMADVNASAAQRDSSSATDDLMARVLGFEAPYLETRFVQYGLAQDRASAQALFLELKRYLFLAAEAPESMPMVSALVDAAWHQFILFTLEYKNFCDEVIGRYQHHGPRVPDAVREVPLDPATFFHAYRGHFGPPPDVWHNERCLRPETRVVHPYGTHFDVESGEHAQRLRRHRPEGTAVVCVVSARAGAALRFIAEHDVFLVRELPGLRNGAEQLALVKPLVENDILQLAF